MTPAMNVKDLFHKNQLTKIYTVEDSENDDLLKWIISPTNFEIIPDVEGHFIVMAKQTYINKTVDCYIDIVVPERIAEYVIKLDKNGKIKFESICEQESTVIPSVASNCMGIYELYYSKENPQIGIDVLKSGLAYSDSKTVISEDLGYIYRDENRLNEAIESFQLSEKNNPTSEYIYHELAQLYRQQGNSEKENEYQQKFIENGNKIEL